MTTVKKIVTPLVYYGGRQKPVKVIIPFIPPYKTYVQPFIGGGVLLWSKPITVTF